MLNYQFADFGFLPRLNRTENEIFQKLEAAFRAVGEVMRRHDAAAMLDAENDRPCVELADACRALFDASKCAGIVESLCCYPFSQGPPYCAYQIWLLGQLPASKAVGGFRGWFRGWLRGWNLTANDAAWFAIREAFGSFSASVLNAVRPAAAVAAEVNSTTTPEQATGANTKSETTTDPTAFRPAKEFIDEDRFPDFKTIRKALDANPEIRRRRPKGKNGQIIPNRLEIHAGDWQEFKQRMQAEPLDSPSSMVDAAIETAGRQAEIHKLKAEQRK
jgi:hypothetical protein